MRMLRRGPIRARGLQRRLAVIMPLHVGKRSPFGIGRIVVALMRHELTWAEDQRRVAGTHGTTTGSFDALLDVDVDLSNLSGAGPGIEPGEPGV